MEYKIDPSGEKNIIKKMAIAIIALIVIGAFIIFFNNPEYIFKYNIRRINNNFINSFCEQFEEIKKLNNNFNANMTIKYNDNDEEVKIYVNKSEDNEYNIICINDKVYIYEKGGIFYLNTPEITETIQLNKEPIKIDYSAIEKLNSKDIKKVYKKITGAFINQMRRNDFYKEKYAYTNFRGKEIMAYQYGIEITEARAKKIILNGLNDIKKDRRFLMKLDRVLKNLNDGNEEISSKEIIEDIIEHISKYEASKELKLQITTRNKGLFALRIDTIKASLLDSDVIIAETNGNIENGQLNLSIVNNKYNNSYNITLKNKKNDKKAFISFTDSDGATHKFEYSSLKEYDKEHQTFLLQTGDIDINYDLTFNDKKAQNGIINTIKTKIDKIGQDDEEDDEVTVKENKEDNNVIDNNEETATIDENKETQVAVEENNKEADKNDNAINDIVGSIQINIGEYKLKYDIKCDITFESKKEEANINRKIKITNLDDEQLGLLGIYFDISAEKLREIIGEQEIIEIQTNLAIPEVENPPTNLAIPETQNPPTNLSMPDNSQNNLNNDKPSSNNTNNSSDKPSNNNNNNLPMNLAR